MDSLSKPHHVATASNPKQSDGISPPVHFRSSCNTSILLFPTLPSLGTPISPVRRNPRIGDRTLRSSSNPRGLQGDEQLLLFEERAECTYSSFQTGKELLVKFVR
ncbi:hypothetical protein MLD38_003441 [Melastoma candidum]|uniref:Uncharacterized protein n=1 Tax=Melastoma candidum TaxID=119954 RepID=A0ACB9S760_9MYRT|nr:hypothetical protein MLD38_003441 [Melastoma candidum]